VLKIRRVSIGFVQFCTEKHTLQSPSYLSTQLSMTDLGSVQCHDSRKNTIIIKTGISNYGQNIVAPVPVLVSNNLYSSINSNAPSLYV